MLSPRQVNTHVGSIMVQRIIIKIGQNKNKSDKNGIINVICLAQITFKKKFKLVHRIKLVLLNEKQEFHINRFQCIFLLSTITAMFKK